MEPFVWPPRDFLGRNYSAVLQQVILRVKECLYTFFLPRVKGVFNSLRTVDEGSKWNDARLNLLGVKGRGVVKKGVSAVHMMMWKHVIPELVRTETKGAEFQTKQVLARAARRYLKREGALKVRVKLDTNGILSVPSAWCVEEKTVMEKVESSSHAPV